MPELTRRLEETITGLIRRGVVCFGSGGAIGFDTLAAQAVLKQRETNPAVKLIMVLPCREQDAKWSASDKREYKRLLDSADKVVCLAEHYYDGCMAKRNLHLVENSGVCVAYMKHGRSGTAQTVRLARERGLTVVNLAEN
ncbi:MAG: SLOG family protein [Oscillospiraceae bacterium]|nr:SLOG family protein [Oscillospiraceae bacterium]